ncbi:tyrosine phosphatase [Podospora didyma]|uniref:Tyrosine phosphatase n=1 Tax=Podospora didyma TaxID=330526 RepID=A0AAE0N786_9PEZI|nr:tyrosine phosphatase [Podospora didyma]
MAANADDMANESASPGPQVVVLPSGTKLPSPPFIHAPGLDNLRDAGGYAVSGSPGKIIRRGVLFRGADPSKLTEEGVAVVSNQLGITHIFDLRSTLELERDGASAVGKPWPGATRSFLPVFLDRDYSPEALVERFMNYSYGTEGFAKAYSSILAAAAEPNHPYDPFRTIIAHLASSTQPPSPLLVHCSAGKDRTGIFIALVLSVCGVDDATVSHEYSLTDLGLLARKKGIVDKITAGGILGGDRARAERMVTSHKENMIATLAMIRSTYGSVEQYLVNHCRVPAEQLEQLRRNLVIDATATEQPLNWSPHAVMVDASYS